MAGMWWEYEPEKYQTADGWVPDFFCCWKTKNKHICFALLEYKPQEVTATYKAVLANRFDTLQSEYKFLVTGSVFNSVRRVEVLNEGAWQDAPPNGIAKEMLHYLEQASTYRFDLAHDQASKAKEIPPSFYTKPATAVREVWPRRKLALK